jgi:hypothetical protein
VGLHQASDRDMQGMDTQGMAASHPASSRSWRLAPVWLVLTVTAVAVTTGSVMIWRPSGRTVLEAPDPRGDALAAQPDTSAPSAPFGPRSPTSPVTTPSAVLAPPTPPPSPRPIGPKPAPAPAIPTAPRTPPAASTGPITVGIDGKCADVRGGSSTDETPIQIYDCNGTAAQTWTMPGDGTIRAFGKCMDVYGARTSNFTEVQLYTCNGGGNQKWQSLNGALVNPRSGRCLDDPAFDTTNGTQLIIYDCNSGANQKWTLPQASPAP